MAQVQDTTYFSGFDYLRAFCAIAVVATHTTIFGQTDMYINKGVHFIVTLAEIFYVNVLLLAVPIFIQISLFLYVTKRKTTADFIKRIKSILVLWFFWIFVNALFTGISIPQPSLWLQFFLTGGGSIFYFFSELLILVVLAELMLKIKKTTDERYFIGITVFLFAISLMVFFIKPEILNFVKCDPQYLYSYWTPTNFFPYVFSTILISWLAEKKPKLTVYIIPVVLLYIVMSFIEWMTLPDIRYVAQNGYAFPTYGRTSVVLAASFLVIFFSLNHYRVPKIIQFFSDNSLAIYGIHMFIIRCKLFDVLQLREPISSFTLFACTLTVTIILVYLIKFKRVV
ncbi:acyltransferase [Pelosinus sp. IPA-1]|uniref:acyltransferase n=1 Tax=Pelosinus sp. IPA-1 TaxID=3029569 RepID=UPI0025525701|nr:acyltransferase [Pelosinus sp. IPA-1]